MTFSRSSFCQESFAKSYGVDFTIAQVIVCVIFFSLFVAFAKEAKKYGHCKTYKGLLYPVFAFSAILRIVATADPNGLLGVYGVRLSIALNFCSFITLCLCFTIIALVWVKLVKVQQGFLSFDISVLLRKCVGTYSILMTCSIGVVAFGPLNMRPYSLQIANISTGLYAGFLCFTYRRFGNSAIDILNDTGLSNINHEQIESMRKYINRMAIIMAMILCHTIVIVVVNIVSGYTATTYFLSVLVIQWIFESTLVGLSYLQFRLGSNDRFVSKMANKIQMKVLPSTSPSENIEDEEETF